MAFSMLESVKDLGGGHDLCISHGGGGLLNLPQRRVVLAAGRPSRDKASEAACPGYFTEKGTEAQRGDSLAV